MQSVVRARVEASKRICRSKFTPVIREALLKLPVYTAPDGLMVHFWGPIEGKRHDITMLCESDVMSHFQQHSAVFDGYAVYGDPAYGANKYIVLGFKNARLSRLEEEFNSMMGSVREFVEWSFGRLTILWVYIDFKKSHKIGLNPVGKYV